MVQADRAISRQGNRKAQLMRGVAIGLFMGASSLSMPVVLPAQAQAFDPAQVTVEGNQTKLMGIAEKVQAT